MDGAAGLLTAPGCPVCRYGDEAQDRYLNWFALEGHADATAIGRLTGSLGMCPPHTRGLMGQPGAARRLTVVYQYILKEARKRLAGQAGPLLNCPMCEHGDAAADRALDTLLDGVADESVRRRCRELGGLCVPHLSAAASAAHRGAVTWLAETMSATLASHSPRLEWLAGTDHDTEVRVVLRRAMPASALPGCYVCAACLAGARAECACIAPLGTAGSEYLPRDFDLLLCARHLGDAATLTGPGQGLAALLAWQANRHLAVRSWRTGPLGAGRAQVAAGWLRVARRRVRPPECAACRARNAAASQALDDLRTALRGSPAAPDQRAVLCARHVLDLRTIDPRAGRVVARDAVRIADVLGAELAEAFRKGTWAGRGEPAGAEATAWRRAAAFVDGGVFCGSPPIRARPSG